MTENIKDLYKLTDQQHEFINAVAYDDGSKEVIAVAGSGKTSTMVAAAVEANNQASFRNGLACCFSKGIQEELLKKMPYGVECKTTHSLGLRALTSHTGVRPKVSKWKSANFLQDQFGDRWAEQEFAVQRADLRRLTGLAKSAMLNPAEDFTTTVDVLGELIEDRNLDIHPADINDFSTLTAQALKQSNEELGEIDFDDMLYLPLIQDVKWPSKYDLVFIDEAQDLSAIQHEMLRKICVDGVTNQPGRLISVGDPNQAIYGWRGAVSNSMAQLAQTWGAEQLGLTCSFRCGTEIIKLAQELVPKISSPANQHEGVVEGVVSLSYMELCQDGTTAVICRNRKPLVDMAFWLFNQNIDCYVSGGDIGRNLMALVNLLGIKDLDQVKPRVSNWRDKQVAYLESKGRLFAADSAKDRAETIITVASRLLLDKPSASIRDLSAFIGKVFKDNGSGIPLMTIHKSKGLEFSNVIFYAPELLPSPYARTPEEFQQESNLRYVAITRAINRLVLAPQDAIYQENGGL